MTENWQFWTYDELKKSSGPASCLSCDHHQAVCGRSQWLLFVECELDPAVSVVAHLKGELKRRPKNCPLQALLKPVETIIKT